MLPLQANNKNCHSTDFKMTFKFNILFEKLKQLKKLKRVYTQFGIKEKDLEPIKKVYEETKWINSMG